MGDRSSSALLRLLRLVRPGRGALCRRVDRLEGALLGVVVLLGVLLAPAMLAAGVVGGTSVAERGEQRVRSLDQVEATLVDDAVPISPGVAMVAGGAGRSDVLATWRLPDGTPRTGPVPATDGLRAGDQVRIWVDREGRVVDPPATRAQAVAVGVAVTVFGWLTSTGLLWLGYTGARALLDRRRHRAWAAEWSRVAPHWTGREP